nr:ECF transporter S component [Streptomyces physcomitrii]
MTDLLKPEPEGAGGPPAAEGAGNPAAVGGAAESPATDGTSESRTGESASGSGTGEGTGTSRTAAGAGGSRTGRETAPAPRRSVIRIRPRTWLVLLLASLAGLAMFFWPLFAPPQPAAMAHSTEAPLLFIVAMPVLLAVVLAEMSSGGIDPKVLALLGVLSAVNAGLRPLGAGTAGIETVFFLLVLAGRVFGPGFGFVLGAVSLFASALLTAGVGPWLPFQMVSSAWIGLGAGLLPRRVTGRAEIAMLAAYGVFAAYFFGFIMNMWFWPFTAGIDTQLSFDPGAPVTENLHTFLIFTLTTSTFGWDTGRALTNLTAILLTGPAVLAVLRRASRRAAFDAPVTFGAAAKR